MVLGTQWLSRGTRGIVPWDIMQNIKFFSVFSCKHQFVESFYMKRVKKVFKYGLSSK